MAYRMIDFACPEHGKFEELISLGDMRLGVEHTKSAHPCPKCGASSPRQLSAPSCVNPKYVHASGDIRKKYVGRT